MAGENKNIALEMMKEQGIDTSIPATPPAGAPPAAAGTPPAIPPASAGTPPATPPVPATPPAGAPPAAAGTPPATPPAGGGDDDDIDDDRVKRALKKRGIDVDKLEDLKKPAEPDKPLTEEEKKEQALKFRENAIKHVLNKKDSGIKSTDITAFELDAAKPPRDIVHQVMLEKWKAEDNELTAEQLEERFTEYYLENLDETDWRRKDREKLMVAQANAIIQQKHKNVLNLEAMYSNDLAAENSAKAYSKTVEDVVKGIPKTNTFEIEVDGEDGVKRKETYTVDFSDDNIAAVKDLMLNEDTYNRVGNGREYTAESLQAIMRLTLVEKELSKLVTTVARSHANKMVLEAKAGRKGALPTHTGDGTVEVNLPPKRTVAHELLEENKR